MVVSKAAEQQIAFLSAAMPTPEVDALSAQGIRLGIFFHNHNNAKSHRPVPEWHGVWCPSGA
jgi:hypothetical protein